VTALEFPRSIARSALFLLRYLLQRERHGDLPEIPEISEVVGLTHQETSDLIDILDDDGSIKANRTIDGGAAPMLTGRGKLKLEELSELSGEKADDAQPLPLSPNKPKPQEFRHSPDYRRVTWQDTEFRFTPMQSHVVRLLHEEFENGRDEVGNVFLIEGAGSYAKSLKDMFKRTTAWGNLIIPGERKGTHRLNLSR